VSHKVRKGDTIVDGSTNPGVVGEWARRTRRTPRARRGEARPRRRAFIFSAMRPQLNRPVESSRDDEALVRHEVSRHDLARVPEHGSQETVVPRPPQLERGIKRAGQKRLPRGAVANLGDGCSVGGQHSAALATTKVPDSDSVVDAAARSLKPVGAKGHGTAEAKKGGEGEE